MVKGLIVFLSIMCFSNTIFANSEGVILSQNKDKNPDFYIGLYGGTGNIIYNKDFNDKWFSSGIYEKNKKSTSYMIDAGVKISTNNFYSIGISGSINEFDVIHSVGPKVRLFYGNNGYKSGGRLKFNFSAKNLMIDNYLRLFDDSKSDIGLIVSLGCGKAKLNSEVSLYGDLGSGYGHIHEKETGKNDTLVKRFGFYFKSKTGILKKFEVSGFFISHKIRKPKDTTKDIREAIKYVDGVLIGIKYNFKGV